VNLGALKSGEYDIVKKDIAEVVKAAQGLTTKVIIETALLTEEEKVKVTDLIIEAGANRIGASGAVAIINSQVSNAAY
jgi:deoxyribose-phosphate aldolase